MGREQAELRGRQRFGAQLRVDAAGLDLLRAQQRFQSIAQRLSPLGKCCSYQ
jgi:hypothetical protein